MKYNMYKSKQTNSSILSLFFYKCNTNKDNSTEHGKSYMNKYPKDNVSITPDRGSKFDL